MKNMLENIKNKYVELNGKLESVNEEEKIANKTKEELALEFGMADDVYQAASDHFNKIEKRINNRKEGYAKRKCTNHLAIAAFSTSFICSIIAFININLGLIAQPFYAYCGAFMMGCIASFFEIHLFWDKIKEKAFNQFEEFESTKRSRDVSDKAYVEKLRAEKELREVQGKIIDNTKVLNAVKSKKHSIENEITELKVNAFDSVMQQNIKENDDIKLILK